MPARHYIFFYEKENKLSISDDEGYEQYTSGIGETLLNFIDLDLRSYEQCRILLNEYYESDFDKEVEKQIIERYPKTYKELLKYHKQTSIEMQYEYFDFIDKNKDIRNITEIYNFPYMQYSETYQFGNPDNEWSFLEYDYNLKKLQDIYKEILRFCFDTEYQQLNKLNALERFYLFRIKKGASYYYDQELKYTQIILPIIKPEVIKSIKENDIDDLVIKYFQTMKPFQITALECATPKDIAFYELYHMLKLDIKMKKCKNCGKYFILKGDYNTDYCDRIPLGEKFTCKKIAAIKARKDKISTNPILKEYEKAYKRKYAQVSNKRLSNEEFRLWVEEAAAKRNEAAKLHDSNPDDQIVKDFKKYLGNK